MPANFVKPRSGSKTVARRGGSGAYTPLPDGYYTGLLESAEAAHYNGKDGTTYLKITPVVKVLDSDHKATIKYSDVVFGAVNEDEELYRPDGDDEKDALFSIAGFFLSAVGFVAQEEDEDGNPVGDPVVDVESFHPDLISGQIVRIKVEQSSYNDKKGVARTKNVITGYYGLSEEEVAEGGYFQHENGMIFANAEAADDFDELFEEVEQAAEDDEYPI